ncbi:MAG TPA: antibiotic biosynthesis monooxygenase family protein [Streptosporangiaceae bacterium]|nr:antibiotic biosynthesis monooxygenase family protein [Streptosporangiaceae bacterium]
MSAHTVRILIWFRAQDGDVSGTEGIERGYATMREELRDRPGLIGSELLRSAEEPDRFAVLSEWESMSDFVAWQREPGHDDDTAPMDAFLDTGRPGGRYADVFVVTAKG